MHVDAGLLHSAIARLRAMAAPPFALPDALVEVTASMPELFSVDGAGLLLVDEEQVLRCVCATDPLAEALEATQEATGRGPCVDAFVDNVIVTVADVAVDLRWPELGPRLSAAGVGAVLGVPVGVGGAAVGSLNVYTKAPHEWDESDASSLAAFAGVVDHLFAAALVGERRGQLAEQLQHALDVRLAVERAVGMLMVLRQVDAADAFAVLRGHARSARISVREVADEIVRRRDAP